MRSFVYFFGSFKPKFKPQIYSNNPVQKMNDFFTGNDAGTLRYILRNVFPMQNADGSIVVECYAVEFEKPKVGEAECVYRVIGYSAVLTLKFKIAVAMKGSAEKKFLNHEIVISDIPWPTKQGMFIINGVRKVFVSQINRSHGPMLLTKFISGKSTHILKIHSALGIAVTLETGINGLHFFKIGSFKKIPIPILFCGIPALEMQNTVENILKRKFESYNEPFINFLRLIGDLIEITFYEDNKTVYAQFEGSIQLLKSFVIIYGNLERIENNKFRCDCDDLVYCLIQQSFLLQKGAKVINIEPYTVVNSKLIRQILSLTNQSELRVQCLFVKARFEAAIEDAKKYSISTYKKYVEKYTKYFETVIVKYGERSDASESENSIFSLLKNLLLPGASYDISPVGRYKLNKLLGTDTNSKTLTYTDIILTILHYLYAAKDKDVEYRSDDLETRRIRSFEEIFGELMYSELMKLKKSVSTFVVSWIADEQNFKRLINSMFSTFHFQSELRTMVSSIPLMQFTEHTNPLALATHISRFSALGPGGVLKTRASNSARDIDSTFIGRSCLVQTPEGPNMGLIISPAIFAALNKLGFICVPLLKVVDGHVSDDICYVSAEDEKNKNIAKYIHDCSKLPDLVICRRNGETITVARKDVHFMDVVPCLMFSLSPCLIPFVKHNDGRRALMGANMLRQALHVFNPEDPVICTGFEKDPLLLTGSSLFASKDSFVLCSTGDNVITSQSIDNEEFDFERYDLSRFQKLNMNSSQTHQSVVKVGQMVQKEEIIADGMCSKQGKIALGRNLLVAFISEGAVFEDAVAASDRLWRDDLFVVDRVFELDVQVKKTEHGEEKITLDVPEVHEFAKKKLDQHGVIRVGSYVKQGDLLVGIVRPTLQEDIDGNEALLRHIFGEKSRKFTDISLYVPRNIEGVVTSVVISNSVNKQDGFVLYVAGKNNRYIRDLKYAITAKMVARLQKYLDKEKGSELNVANLCKMSWEQMHEFQRSLDISDDIKDSIDRYLKNCAENLKRIKEMQDANIQEIASRSAHYEGGTIQSVKIQILSRRQTEIGDKFSGRHGNKGVLSCVIPECDMPFLNDGTPIDMLLNLTSVPSRMNIGQLIETALGKLSRDVVLVVRSLVKMGEANMQKARDLLLHMFEDQKIADEAYVSIMDGQKYLNFEIPVGSNSYGFEKIAQMTKQLDQFTQTPRVGMYHINDGKTGEPMSRPVTVGIQYMMALNHRTVDKVRARSVGPYNQVTQQAASIVMKSKDKEKGLKFGYMENWAAFGSGVAQFTKENLTLTSDDIEGRQNMYSRIVKNGDITFNSTYSETTSLMIKELKAACILPHIIEVGKKYEKPAPQSEKAQEIFEENLYNTDDFELFLKNEEN